MPDVKYMNYNDVCCKLCGYTWKSTLTRLPKTCPKCKRYDNCEFVVPEPEN